MRGSDIGQPATEARCRSVDDAGCSGFVQIQPSSAYRYAYVSLPPHNAFTMMLTSQGALPLRAAGICCGTLYVVATLGFGAVVSLAMRCAGGQSLGERAAGIRLVREVSRRL